MRAHRQVAEEAARDTAERVKAEVEASRPAEEERLCSVDEASCLAVDVCKTDLADAMAARKLQDAESERIRTEYARQERRDGGRPTPS